MLLVERYQKMNPELGAIHAGAKVTQLGAVGVGVKPSCHLPDDADLAVTWRRHHWRQAWRHGSWRRAVGIS
jgi:hypothetical protein